MQDHLLESVDAMLKERGGRENWRKLDGERVLEMMKEYYIDNYCKEGEAPYIVPWYSTGTDLTAIKCSTGWEYID